MSRLGALALVALGGAAGCIDVPPHCPGTAGDCDGDGWPAVGVNPGASDCDDHDPAVNPGAADDASADRDCLPGTPPPLARVEPTGTGWSAGPARVLFDGAPQVPSSLAYGGFELLAGETGPCTSSNEEFAGVGLYPVVGMHARGTIAGQRDATRAGPALGSSTTTWQRAIADTGATGRCDQATTLSGTVTYHQWPTPRLVRDETVTFTAAIATCTGGAGCPPTGAPTFTSYYTFARALDRFVLDGLDSMSFPTMPGDSVPFGSGGLACVQPPAPTAPAVAIAWRTADTYAGVRMRTTQGGNRAAVFDWVREGAVAADPRHLVTSLAIDALDPTTRTCSAAAIEAVREAADPPALPGFTLLPGMGPVYDAPTDAGARLVVSGIAASVRHGLVLRRRDPGAAGVTVWRQRSGVTTRLARDAEYLLQREFDGALLVYLPELLSSDVVTIATPGAEPGP